MSLPHGTRRFKSGLQVETTCRWAGSYIVGVINLELTSSKGLRIGTSFTRIVLVALAALSNAPIHQKSHDYYLEIKS